MSTLTPNYELIVPEATDTLEQVRADYATNLGKIDNIGGGGGGSGHTIIDKNGNSMPQETGLQFTGDVTVTDDSVNNKTVVNVTGGGGGGGTVYGCFIDTNNIITSGMYSQTFSYTATRDCFMYIQVIANTNDSAIVTLDGETILAEWTSALHTSPFLIPMKQGQVLAVTSSHPALSSYTVYGVTQGTESIFTPIIYSDNERVVGVWRDNKPLYQKTWDLGSDITVNANSWTNTAISVSDFNIEKIVNVGCINSGGTLWDFVGANCDQAYVQLLQTRNVAITVRYVTLCYTKTTDSAGSGNWNTDGVPTVHYSTSEQVIGTWIDGKPLYERTINGGALSSGTHNIETLTVEEVKFIKGFMVDPNDSSYMRPLPFPADSSNTVRVDVSNNVLRIITYSSWSGYSAYLTIQYTKSTD